MHGSRAQRSRIHAMNDAVFSVFSGMPHLLLIVPSPGSPKQKAKQRIVSLRLFSSNLKHMVSWQRLRFSDKSARNPTLIYSDTERLPVHPKHVEQEASVFISRWAASLPWMSKVFGQHICELSATGFYLNKGTEDLSRFRFAAHGNEPTSQQASGNSDVLL